MGLDMERVVLGSSSSSGKQKQWSNNVRKGKAKTPISPSISSGTGSEDSRSSKYENGGKHSAGLNSVVAGSESIGTSGVKKGNGISNPFTDPLDSSLCDSRKRQPDLRSASSNEGSPKSAKRDNTRLRNTAPKGGSHCKKLSYGNIYRPSKNSISERDPQNLRDAHVNENVPGVDGSMGSIVEPSQSNKYAVGSGRCDYGYGNIIRGAKNVENNKSNCEVTRGKNITEKQNYPIPKTAPHFESVEELKNAGNEEYMKGCFGEAISFYNKAIALCPQNAACHNNKAAALAALGKVTEAVGECLEAIKHDQLYSHAHYRLGTLYTRLGEVDDAKCHFDLSGQDSSSEVAQRLLRLEAHLKRMKEARKAGEWDCVLMESTLSIEAGADTSNEVIAVKAEALLKLHRAKEALELLAAARVSEENRSRKACILKSGLLIIESQVNLYLGRFEEGIVAAEQAAKLDYNKESLMWLSNSRGVADARKAGNEFFKARKYLEACTMYTHGLKYVPTSSVLLCNRAACKSKLGQWEKAIDDCNAALENRANYFKAILRRAHSNFKLERWEESVRDYSVLSKEMPGDRQIADSLLQVEMKLKMARGNTSSSKMGPV